MNPAPDITVILPVRDESDTTIVPGLLALNGIERVMIVDDGATDAARKALTRWSEPRLQLLALPEAAGWGAAVRRGLRAVDAAIVVALQPQDRPAAVGLLAASIHDGGDLAVGRRHDGLVGRAIGRGGSFAVRTGLVRDLDLVEEGCELTYELIVHGRAAGWDVAELDEATATTKLKLGRVALSRARWTRLAVRRRDRLALRRSPTAWEQSDSELASTLDNLDGAENYANWIMSLMEPHVTGRILEVGAGHGTFTGLLAEHGSVTATDLSDRAVAVLAERYAGSDHVTVVHANDLRESAFDVAVLVNVLEHIPDDVGALRSLSADLRPGGHVVVYSPAFNALYSRFDAAVGHYRRYTTSSLRRVVRDAELELVDIRYVNLPGALAWYVVATRLGLRPTQGWLTRAYDRVAVPVVRGVETHLRPPFGQSLLVVARRPMGPPN